MNKELERLTANDLCQSQCLIREQALAIAALNQLNAIDTFLRHARARR